MVLLRVVLLSCSDVLEFALGISKVLLYDSVIDVFCFLLYAISPQELEILYLRILISGLYE